MFLATFSTEIIMNHLKHLTLSLSLIAGWSSGAFANAVLNTYETFDFTGTCSDCSGTVSGVLQLENYTDGAQIGASNFISFTYNGSNLFNPYTLNSEAYLSGTLGTSNSSDSFFITGYDANNIFVGFNSTEASGIWSTGIQQPADTGTNAVWSQVNVISEPGSLALVGIGILGVTASRRKAQP